ncbi:hypothetical protein [Halopelagius longus]|nr:hypothetical protein [Halopelagius longus]RDI70193.1 hypothetical protein DWB78_16395 [Halopelagius longus]
MRRLQPYFRFGVLLIFGVVVFAAAYASLGKVAGVFFGFIYILAAPVLYEVVRRGWSLVSRAESA